MHPALDIALLRTFLAVADTGNFLQAAEAVGRSPSAVSMQIKRLEGLLSATLFSRTARSTKLTEQGQRLLPHARRMVNLEGELLTSFHHRPIKGDLRLGVPDDVVERFPMEALCAFNELHPDVTLSVIVDHTPSLIRAVEADTIDLALVTCSDHIEGIENAKVLFREPEVWAERRLGELSRRSPVPIAVWGKGWSAWNDMALQMLDEASIEYRVVFESENISSRKAAIESDLAVGPLPLSQLDGNLQEVQDFSHLPPLPEYGLGLYQCQKPSDLSKAVGELLQKSFRNELPRGRAPAGR